MTKGLILYQSKYGATKRYADWLAEITGFDCVKTPQASVRQAAEYDVIVLMGGIYASGVAGLSFFKKNRDALAGKRLAVFCVGASPYDEAALAQLSAHNLKDAGIPCFYGRGAWDEAAMSFADRTLCKMLQKAVAKQDPATYEPWQRALMSAVGQTCDWTDKAYLVPLTDWIGL